VAAERPGRKKKPAAKAKTARAKNAAAKKSAVKAAVTTSPRQAASRRRGPAGSKPPRARASQKAAPVVVADEVLESDAFSLGENDLAHSASDPDRE